MLYLPAKPQGLNTLSLFTNKDEKNKNMPCRWQIDNYQQISQWITFTDGFTNKPLDILSDNWTKNGHIMIDATFSTKQVPNSALILSLTVMPWGGLLENSKKVAIPLTLS